MNNPEKLSFVVLVGSIRKGSYHAAIASSLQSLVPEGVTVTVLGSVGDIPHYAAGLQAEGFPARILIEQRRKHLEGQGGGNEQRRRRKPIQDQGAGLSRGG